MNIDLVLQIAGLALRAAETHLSGTSKHDVTIEKNLLEIIQKSVTAYEQHVGETLDPSMIRPEQPI